MKKILIATTLLAGLSLAAPAHASFWGGLASSWTSLAGKVAQSYRNNSTFYAPYGPVYRNLTNAQAQSILNRYRPTSSHGSGSQPSYSYSPSAPAPGTSNQNPPD